MRWVLKSIQISGGFLAGLALELPEGLTCVIGPRGSGKSTLAEAIRYGIGGGQGASKPRAELIQANLSGAVLNLSVSQGSAGGAYTIRRVFREPASVITADGKVVTSVDLDRGTFLPLDAYSSSEIEAIADEALGDRRRGLLDELRADALQAIQLSVSDKRRALDSNADAIRATERSVADLTEHVEELAGARARLAALPPAAASATSQSLVAAARQQQANVREQEFMANAEAALASLRDEVDALAGRLRTSPGTVPASATSPNFTTVAEFDLVVRQALEEAAQQLDAAAGRLARGLSEVAPLRSRLQASHEAHESAYAALQAEDQAAGEAVRHRQDVEQAVARLEALEADLERTRGVLTRLREERKALKGTYLLERERISNLREEVANRLQADAVGKVRVRVLRNADSMGYRTMLMEGLKGARVKNHDDILDCLLRLRPEQLAQLVADQDADEFELHTALGTERCRRILEAFRSNLDPLAMEVVTIDDRITIELNVSTSGEPNFKDASELSRGQKCTALLPLLLARRDTPLVIDQPEDNLDNHFIYETVVDSIRHLKTRRQMIFITHNANIPVLAEADLVVVLNSDGRRGVVEKAGALDRCREEIIDLLEGGREAFDLRRRRYEEGR